MSVSDPMLKELKSYILEMIKEIEEKPITDAHPSLPALCACLESIFRKGLISSQPSPFGITKKDYWAWMQSSLSTSNKYTLSFKMSLSKIIGSPRIKTIQGRGRLFIRHSLQNKSLHISLEQLVRDKSYEKIYRPESIIGDEILGEIFLSLVYQLSQLNFDLNIENAAFLDSSFHLPQYKKFQIQPCLDLGMYLGHVKGWAVVLKVDEGSIAAEDSKIERGDVIDELFGICIKGWKKNRISALFKQNEGMPISLNVIKCRNPDGSMFFGMLPILRLLQINLEEESTTEEESCNSEELSTSQFQISGQTLEFLGSVDVGTMGDVGMIENAVATILDQKPNPIPVALITGEIGVQAINKSNNKILLKHSYTEISSCGRRNDTPLVFGYIAGDANCSMCEYFTCYVFRTTSEDTSRDILLTLADGFHRTHWAV